ncbi:MAG: aldo/keto reductase [Proteobacteria bacterium]|nr:aldo/keto reductase [Pseudomonadota bacterium]
MATPLIRAAVTRFTERRRRRIAWERPRSTQDFSPRYVKKVVESSLFRLSTECIDLMYLHSPPASLIEQDDAFDTVIRLREAGKIRYLAFSTRPGPAYPLDTLAQVGLQAVQLPLSPGNSDDANTFLPWARINGIGTVINMPFNKGVALRLQGHDWGVLADGSPRTLAQAALRFAVQSADVTCAIPGTSKIAHLEENVTAVNSPPLTSAEIERLTSE